MLGGICSYLVGGNVKKADKRVKAKGVAGNTKGEGMKLGGLWVIDPSKGILFEHAEAYWGQGGALPERSSSRPRARAPLFRAP